MWTLSVARTASLHRSWAPVSGVRGLATTHPLHRSRGLAEIEKLFLGPNCKNRCRCWCSASIHRLWMPVHSVAIVAATATTHVHSVALVENPQLRPPRRDTTFHSSWLTRGNANCPLMRFLTTRRGYTSGSVCRIFTPTATFSQPTKLVRFLLPWGCTSAEQHTLKYQPNQSGCLLHQPCSQIQ